MANSVLVEQIPKKIQDAIDDEQTAFKKATGVKLNQSKAIIKMLRDYLRCKSDHNFKPPTE